jgi:uncharacterized membrane protein YqgA involved in biofilm formation
MLGTILNAAGILIGGGVGLIITRQPSPATQLAAKGLMGVGTVIIGLRLTWLSVSGGFLPILKQLVIVLLALILGKLAGRLLHLQKASNRLGQYARARLTKTRPGDAQRFSDGFNTCALLFCAGPLAVIGAVSEGLSGHWQPLAIKAVMDGLATMGFVSIFGWGAMLSALPVFAYQGTITLCVQHLAPFLRNHALLDSVNATGGMLVFCVALVILELKKIELADYLPSLAFAPLITWLWR